MGTFRVTIEETVQGTVDIDSENCEELGWDGVAKEALKRITRKYGGTDESKLRNLDRKRRISKIEQVKYSFDDDDEEI